MSKNKDHIEKIEKILRSNNSITDIEDLHVISAGGLNELLQSLQNSNVVNKIHYDIEEKDTIKIESLQSLINKVIHHLLGEEEGRRIIDEYMLYQWIKVINLNNTYIPNIIANFHNLEKLSLINNKGLNLDRIIENISMLKKLKEIDISWCNIIEIPKSICAIKSLEQITIKGSYEYYLNRYEKLLYEYDDDTDKALNFMGYDTYNEMIKDLKKIHFVLKKIPKELFHMNNLKTIDISGHNFNKSSEILKDYYSIKDKNKPYIVLY